MLHARNGTATFVLIGLCGALSATAVADTKTVVPNGEYAQIDTRLAVETMQVLAAGAPMEVKKAIKSIKEHPENYAPPVFYALSATLFKAEKKNDAAFWFHAGQLRARFDANRCTQSDARQAVDVLNNIYGPPINKYSFQNIHKLGSLILKVVAWDKKTPHNYDQRWINLHGMGAVFSGLGSDTSSKVQLSLPKDQWNDIAEKTRSSYLSDFYDTLKAFKNGKPAQKSPYSIREGVVWYDSSGGPKQVTAADVATFEYLDSTFGKDKQHVFFGDAVVSGADPTSFVVIDFYTGRDASAIYRASALCTECDPASFRKIDDKWYVDKNAAYSALSNKWIRLPGVEAQSFKGLNEWFAKDNRRVFLSGSVVSGADAASFKLESCGDCKVCGEDKNRCYWFDHAVPCDCKPHSGAEFPSAMKQMSAGKAVIKLIPPYWPDSYASLGGVMSAGYLVIAPGKQVLSAECRNSGTRSKFTVELTIDLEADRFYRLARTVGTSCDVEIERPALVRGKIDFPQIQIQLAAEQKAKLQVELAAGPNKLTAVCRDVTRTEVIERSTDLNLDLKAGMIYELHSDFKAPEYKCDVSATPL